MEYFMKCLIIDVVSPAIAEEPGNCYLYEKMGYHPTGRLQPVNERLTLIFYEKTVE